MRKKRIYFNRCIDLKRYLCLILFASSFFLIAGESVAAIRTVTNNSDSGIGSLRAAIAAAADGDIITFSAGMTVNLTSKAGGAADPSTMLYINKNLTIQGDLSNDGMADVTLNGQTLGRVLEIASGKVVTLEGVNIALGLATGSSGSNGANGYGTNGSNGGDGRGGCILNAGTLYLLHTGISACTAQGGIGGNGGGGSAGSGNGGNGGNGGNAYGGAIYNTGTLITSVGSGFAANKLVGGTGGNGGGGGGGSGALGGAQPGNWRIGGAGGSGIAGERGGRGGDGGFFGTAGAAGAAGTCVTIITSQICGTAGGDGGNGGSSGSGTTTDVYNAGSWVQDNPPSFIGPVTTFTVNQNAGAVDIKDMLHVKDTDTGQTETWSVGNAPNHGGTLSFSGATAASGSADIAPGGSITYQPEAGFFGTETFSVQVSDGSFAATRSITVTVLGAASVPSGVTAGTATTPTSLSVYWTPGTANDCVFSSWDVQFAAGGSGFPAGCTGLTSRGTVLCIAQGLTPGTWYQFMVREICSDGSFNSPQSSASAPVLTSIVPKTAASIIIDTSTNPATIYAGIDTEGVYRSTDNTNWNPSNGMNPTDLKNLRVKALARSTGGTIYAATYGGGVFKTANGGGAWAACDTVTLTNLNVVSLIIDATGKLYSGTEAGVFVSDDDCETWTAMNNGLPN